MDRKEFITNFTKSLAAGAFFLTGCSDLLDQNNPNEPTSSNFWQTGDDAKSNVTSIYNVFGANNWPWRVMADVYRSDASSLTHDVADLVKIGNFIPNSSNSRVESRWNNCYQGIFRANQVIHHVPDISSMDKSLRKRYIGEAKALRAYFYFDLIINWLNVPLRLDLKESDGSYDLKNSPPEEVWSQIEKDLNEASSVLPSSYDSQNLGRMTEGAALGLLGKAYLYQEKWQEAIDTFKQVKSSNTYALTKNYFDNFTYDKEFNEESLIEVQYSQQTFKGQSITWNRNYAESAGQAGGYVEDQPLPWVFSEMTKEKTKDGRIDPRTHGTIMWKDSGLKYYGKSWESLFGDGFMEKFWRKYNDSELSHTLNKQSGKNLRVLRYADVLLMYAEALNEIGKTSDAYQPMNMIRNRAQLSDLQNGMNQDEMRDEIRHQRVMELTNESVRYFDISRWGIAKNRLKVSGHEGSENYVKGKTQYLPIPNTELQSNSKVTQNPGY